MTWQSLRDEAMEAAAGDKDVALQILARECVYRGKGMSYGHLRLSPVTTEPTKTQPKELT